MSINANDIFKYNINDIVYITTGLGKKDVAKGKIISRSFSFKETASTAIYDPSRSSNDVSDISEVDYFPKTYIDLDTSRIDKHNLNVFYEIRYIETSCSGKQIFKTVRREEKQVGSSD